MPGLDHVYDLKPVSFDPAAREDPRTAMYAVLRRSPDAAVAAWELAAADDA